MFWHVSRIVRTIMSSTQSKAGTAYPFRLASARTSFKFVSIWFLSLNEYCGDYNPNTPGGQLVEFSSPRWYSTVNDARRRG
jgi:hypothetical protein